MIGFFKKLQKTLSEIANLLGIVVYSQENKLIFKQIGETQKILLDISDKMDAQTAGMKSLQKYFDYELKRMKEIEAEEKLPPGKHDYDF